MINILDLNLNLVAVLTHLYIFFQRRHMKKSNIVSRLRKFLSCSDGGSHMTGHPIGVDVREEYANAFRTESYLDFWTRVVALNDRELRSHLPVESTAATRLSSYRLFAEQLLDLTQPTIKTILTSAHLRPNSNSLLSDYFSLTANASLLCSRLLKDVNNLRLKLLHPLQIAIQSSENTQIKLWTHNPFLQSTQQVQAIQNGCSKLLKRLEFSRDEARAKLKRARYFQHGSAGFLVAVTASLTVIVLTHGIAVLVAAPGLLVGAVKLAKSGRLAKEVARLDVAAKGSYTLNRDFDTVGRLVARLSHEVEHVRVLGRFWVERGEDCCSRRRAESEVARRLKQSHGNCSRQLDELEEHLYLCFMTINRARNLVVKEILDSGLPVKTSYG